MVYLVNLASAALAAGLVIAGILAYQASAVSQVGLATLVSQAGPVIQAIVAFQVTQAFLVTLV